MERLKELDEQHAKVRLKLQNRRNICHDVSEFTDKLSKASKVEFKKCVFSEEDPGYKFESIITKDKLLIEEICSLLSDKIEYDPLLTRKVFESGRRPSVFEDIDPLPSSMTIGTVTGDSRGAVELIIDDQDCVYLSHFTVECLAKAYSYDPGERRGLDEQIELILKKK